MSDVERFGKLRDHLVSTRRQEVAKVLASIACHHPETESVIQSEEDHPLSRHRASRANKNAPGRTFLSPCERSWQGGSSVRAAVDPTPVRRRVLNTGAFRLASELAIGRPAQECAGRTIAGKAAQRLLIRASKSSRADPSSVTMATYLTA
jgi:hypothetical protein